MGEDIQFHPIARVIEHKHPGRPLKDSQKDVLELVAKSVQLLSATRLVHPHSGVFVVRSELPHESGVVERIDGWQPRKTVPKVELLEERWREFLTGEECLP